MAKKITVERPYSLSLEDAKAKLRELATLIADRYKVNVNMQNEERATVEGRGVSGFASVANGKAAIDLELGLLARPFAGKIETTIQDYIAKYFA